jgi:hypothetical protein
MTSVAVSFRHDARHSWWRALVVLAVLIPLSQNWLPAQQDERAVRAAFVFNLTKYVTWPHPRERLVIGVIGEGNMGPVLKQILDGKVSDGRRIIVLMHSSDAELRECDLLYVAESSPARIRSILDRVGSRAVLTVGDTEQFTRTGGMVGLVRSGEQIEIEVNLDALRSRQLEMSSRLLNLAVIVSASGGIR